MTFYMFRLIILLRIDCINTTCTLVDPSENLGPLQLVFPLIGFSIDENPSDVCGLHHELFNVLCGSGSLA